VAAKRVVILMYVLNLFHSQFRWKPRY